MAIQSFVINPEAGPMTGNEIIVAINAGSDVIDRAGCVDPAARPIEANEVTNDELGLTAAKDNLLAMDDVDRGVVLTRPEVGEFPVISIDRTAAGLLEVDYDDVAVE